LDLGWIAKPDVIGPDCGNPLYDSLRIGELAVLESNRHQTTTDGFDEFARFQKELRIFDPPVALIPNGECFVDQQAIGRDAGHDVRKDWSPKIVRHDHTGERAAAEWKWPAIFEIGRHQLDTRSAFEIRNTGKIAVHAGHLVASLERKPQVPAAAAGDIKHSTRAWNAGQESFDPL